MYLTQQLKHDEVPENTFAASNSSENTEIQNITEKTTTENTLKSNFDEESRKARR